MWQPPKFPTGSGFWERDAPLLFTTPRAGEAFQGVPS
jgi:hypothetical protein